MKYIIAFAIIVVIAVVVLSINSPKTVSTELTPAPTDQPYLNAEKLTTLINDWRVSQGLQPYLRDERLCDIARKRVKFGNDEHRGFLKEYGNGPVPMSENAFWDVPTEDAALTGWLNSKGHRDNLEYPFTHSCIAVDKYNAIQIFAIY